MISKCKKLLGILKKFFYIRALQKGAAAGVEHENVLLNLGKCRHIVDVGANRGQFALVSRYCFPNARIDSFEPLQEPADIYREVFVGDNNVELHPYAIGEEKGEIEIHISNRDDSSSLLPIAEMQTELFPGTEEKETRTINVIPLEAILSEDKIITPALLKLDVQGFELSALKGCATLLQKFNNVYVECSFVELYAGQSFADEVISFLSAHKFRFVGVYNMCYDKSGKAIQADFLFERNE